MKKKKWAILVKRQRFTTWGLERQHLFVSLSGKKKEPLGFESFNDYI